MGLTSFLRVSVFALAGAAAGLGAGVARADDATTPQTVEDLRGLSIDDLANLKVTSVSRRPQSLADAAAAVYVITADDIRRSGALSLPEALRLAPNLEVARINGYAWAISARGFNSAETANKLLVMVNGRSVYEPIGGGVLWQQVDVDMANVERIEVISGPGGTLWGANAVNGVINVITKDAAATQGLAGQVSAGGFERAASLRYGAKIGQHMTLKAMADTFDDDATAPATAGDTTSDAFRGSYGSLSLGGNWDRDSLSAGLMAYDNRVAHQGGKLTGQLGRVIWNHTQPGGSSVSLNLVVSRDVRQEPTLYESRDSVFVSAQQAIQWGSRQQFVWGGEFRYWWEDFVSFNNFQFARPKTEISLGSLFAQDEIALTRNLKLTLGVKGEHSSYSGFEWLPNVRLAWQPDDRNLVWAAMSGSARTPNRIERELEYPGLLQPSPDFESERVTALEAGWRARPSSRLSLSVSAYYNRYDDLRTDGYTLPDVVPIILRNGGRGRTYGVEAWGDFAVTPDWRLSAGVSTLDKRFWLKEGYNDLTGLGVQGQDPHIQAQVGSDWTINRHLEFDVNVRHVGKVDTAPVPAYTEADAHLEWHVSSKLSLALDGRNLLHKQHLEVVDPSLVAPRYVPRSVFVTLRVGF